MEAQVKHGLGLDAKECFPGVTNEHNCVWMHLCSEINRKDK
jgi:hypothetical protein